MPTIANVAVAKDRRRAGAGRALVDGVAETLGRDDAWRAWREFVAAEDDYVYARVADDQAEQFWRRVGFVDVPKAADGAADARGRTGLWLRRPLER